MRLYRLIGLEMEALLKEHEATLEHIAKYEDLLNNYDSMAQAIMNELDAVKKEFGRKRRTALENAQEAVFEEKKIEEMEVWFLMDRFGYVKSVFLHEHGPDLYFYGCRKDARSQGLGYSTGEVPR